jgi:hypothetical protein
MPHPDPKPYAVHADLFLTFIEPLVHGLTAQGDIGPTGELVLRVECYQGKVTRIRQEWGTTVFKAARDAALR